MGFMRLYYRYDRAIWIRVIGTILTTLTGFAIRPFLALYLYNKTGNLYDIGIILGLAPLMGVLANIWGGGLADKYGRKPLMVWSLMFQGISMLGYIFAVTPLHFALVSVLNGVASSFYFPAANAQIADIVPIGQRSEVFALMHTALNVGAALGPLLGLFMISINQSLTFLASAISLILYGLLVLALIPETLHCTTSSPEKGNAVEVEAAINPERISYKGHKFLFQFTLLAIPITLLYAVVESIFPLYLQANFTNYLTIFTSLVTLNGILVVLIAVWLAKKTEKLHTPSVLLVGYILFAFVGVGYGLGTWTKIIPLLFAAEVILTIAECLTFPNQSKLLSVIAPDHMRARYFSIFSMNWGLSKSLGPILGVVIFAHLGGLWLFLSLSCLLLASGASMYYLTSTHKQVILDEGKVIKAST